MADSVGSLEDEAQKRRERLKAMRKQTMDEASDCTEAIPGSPRSKRPADEAEAPVLPKPKFRSYNPKSEELQGAVLPKAVPVDVNALVRDQLEAAADGGLSENIGIGGEGEKSQNVDDVQLLNLAPRKPDWDLKRDVAKSLEKLERRTQRAIAELIRERLATSKDNENQSVDLAQAVTWGAKAQEQSTIDDWES
ncbi:coiled-coil domain-containing protein 12-like [Paramacrobiotus metropolitanus]|uniref:coiled-coil domain-containing protein 12-like n=1 Tax=Paramacrobiotus metropolitanus TaxID=2943436 RepID=UPI002445B31A|nr:coiled-coil domain-containing protein 12-like [Paramacrobiotus metropolitanus]